MTRTWITVALVALTACSANAPVTLQRDQTAAAETSSTTPPTDASDSGALPLPTTDPDASDTTLVDDAPETIPNEDGDGSTRAPDLGVGDSLFPDLGSADVDVISYLVHIDASNASELEAVVTVTADVDGDVEVLPLDATTPEIDSVVVDGVPATFDRSETELLIDLPVDRRSEVTATISYSFAPQQQRSPVGLPVGWIPTGGSSYVLNEPDGARAWLPANDHPSDKATWRFELVAPSGSIAAANGELVQRGTETTPWIWEQTTPMSTYLVQVIVGPYEVIEADVITSASGREIPLTHVVPKGDAATFEPAFESINEQIAFFEELFGPYPLDRYGLAFVDGLSGLAMETQGRSMFGALDFGDGSLGYFQHLLLSHELAHQWFGDAVSPVEWSDLWLNESFATYAQWLWLDSIDLQPLDTYALAMLDQRRSGSGSTGSPSIDDMFGFNRYDGGAVVVHALRRTMGDQAFFELLTTWVGANTGTSRSTGDFVALATEINGASLTDFFDTWLYAQGLPDAYP